MSGLDELPMMLLRLAIAFVLALPVGWEREHRALSPGLRTFPLVATGACAFLLVGQHIYPNDAGAQAYALQAVLSGIGFIGGGAIIKGKAGVQGLATAASLWITAAVGVAVAHGLYFLGAALSLVTVGALQLLKPLKHE